MLGRFSFAMLFIFHFMGGEKGEDIPRLKKFDAIHQSVIRSHLFQARLLAIKKVDIAKISNISNEFVLFRTVTRMES